MKMMLPGSRTPAAVASLCLALTCAFVGLAHGQQSTYLAPVFLWSPASDYVTVADPGVTSRVSYETTAARNVAEGLLDTLLTTQQPQQAAHNLLNATGVQATPPQRVVFFLGKQVSTEELGQASAQEALQPLRSAVEAAGSSLSLPHVLHKGAESFVQVVTGHMQARGVHGALHTLGCSGEGSMSASALKTLLSDLEQQDEPQVILVCSEEDSLSAEMQMLHAVHAAVAEDGRAHVMVYAADQACKMESRERAGVGRSLLQQQRQAAMRKAAATYTCDARCETQVKLLEGVILAFNLIIAVLVGSCMLNNLGTPTRFETPKDTGRQD